MILAQEPKHTSTHLSIALFVQFLLEALEFLLAQRIETTPIVLSHMEAIDHDLGCYLVMLLDKVIGRLQVAFPHISGEIVNCLT